MFLVYITTHSTFGYLLKTRNSQWLQGMSFISHTICLSSSTTYSYNYCRICETKGLNHLVVAGTTIIISECNADPGFQVPRYQFCFKTMNCYLFVKEFKVSSIDTDQQDAYSSYIHPGFIPGLAQNQPNPANVYNSSDCGT